MSWGIKRKGGVNHPLAHVVKNKTCTHMAHTTSLWPILWAKVGPGRFTQGKLGWKGWCLSQEVPILPTTSRHACLSCDSMAMTSQVHHCSALSTPVEDTHGNHNGNHTHHLYSFSSPPLVHQPWSSYFDPHANQGLQHFPHRDTTSGKTPHALDPTSCLNLIKNVPGLCCYYTRWHQVTETVVASQFIPRH